MGYTVEQDVTARALRAVSELTGAPLPTGPAQRGALLKGARAAATGARRRNPYRATARTGAGRATFALALSRLWDVAYDAAKMASIYAPASRGPRPPK